MSEAILEVVMKALLLCSALLLLAVPVGGQYPNLNPSIASVPRPPEINHRFPAEEPQPDLAPPAKRRTIDSAQAKRDAAELADLAQHIPPKVDLVAKGQLPKDLVEKLKRIEKLSKQLRHELVP